jgi:hypothetical protein
MKIVGTYTKLPVKVLQNTRKHQANFAEIRDARTGEQLHRGQVGYIKRLAATRYNVIARIS